MASPRRPNYKLFSEPMRSETIAQRDALRCIRQEIRACKHNGSTRTELEPLYEKKRALTEAQFQARSRLKVVRAEVKSELLRIRAVHRGEEEGSAVASSDDPWEVRIPGMEKLFPAHDSAARQVAVAQASLNLQAEGGNGARQLRQQIDAAMAKSCPGPLVTDFGHLDAVLFGTASQQNILRLLDSIQADDDLLDCCVKQSYHHDLFDKLVLLSGEAHEWKLRMHIFRPEKFTVSQEEVHSHRNHFVSHILHGGFRHELWEPIRDVDTRPDAPDTRELFKYTYDPLVTADGKRVFNIEPGGKVQMKKLDEVEVMSGTTYYMHPSVLHAVTALQGATVTCVLNSPQVHEKSCFATHEPWADETFERVRFTREEVVEAFQLVRELLSAPEEAGGGFVDRGAERS